MTATVGRRRLRFRFSLRALLVAMLLIGCAVSWFVSRTRLAMRQQKAARQIRSQGGHATFEYQLDPARRGQSPPMAPNFVRMLTGDVVMSDVVKVSWHASRAGARETQALSDLPRLQDLRLNMRRLTDDGIQPLGSLTQLRRLDLWASQLTDEALPHLAGLRQLRMLDLYSTQVTDEGLRHLHGLKNLEVLKLRGTNVTPAGAARLRQALPACEILGVDGWPKRDSPTNGPRTERNGRVFDGQSNRGRPATAGTSRRPVDILGAIHGWHKWLS